MPLSRADVEKVALLARLDLSDREIESMTVQLGQVLTYIELLGELDTVHVAPMAHAVEISNVLADDALLPSLPRDEALSQSPSHSDEFFLVPAVLGE